MLLTKEEEQVLQNNIKGEDIIFDVGSYHGEWSIYAASLAYKVKAFCFEPSKLGFWHLYRNTRGIDAECTNMAVSDNDGYLEYWHIPIAEHSSGSSAHFRNSSTVWQGFSPVKTVVPCLTLDKFAKAHEISRINFLKIDVEGHEDSVLLGAENLLKNHAIDKIQLEYGLCWVDANKKLLDTIIRLYDYGYVNFSKVETGEHIDINNFNEDFQYCNIFIT